MLKTTTAGTGFMHESFWKVRVITKRHVGSHTLFDHLCAFLQCPG
jgi:hypothetical protein